MLVKIMGPEDAPDADTRKSFILFDNVAMVSFLRHQDGTAVAQIDQPDHPIESFEIVGNAYVLNSDGEEIVAFGAAPIPELHPEAEQGELNQRPASNPPVNTDDFIAQELQRIVQRHAEMRKKSGSPPKAGV